jgi:spermidine synthase
MQVETITTNRRGMAVLYQGQSPFGELLVTWSARARTVSLYHQDFLQSRADINGIAKVDYIHAIHDMALQGRALAPKAAPDALLLGCGGGTLGTMLSRDHWRVTMVDINPMAFELARRFFDLAPNIACLVEDGFGFLRRTRAKFDVIVCDMYLGDEVAPYSAAPSFIAQAAKRLRPGGRIFLNVIVYGDRDPAADRLALAAKAVGLTARILDGRGHVGRNAVLCLGDVTHLRKPRLRQPPQTGAGVMEQAIAKYRFRRISRARALKDG